MKPQMEQFVDKTRKLLKVCGKDAKKFLQGIITNDIQDSISAIIYTGLLTPQGKYLFDFFIFGLDEENFIIDIDVDSYDDFIKKINLYKLRSNVLVNEFESSVILGFGESIKGSYFDPRNKKLGWRKIACKDLINDNLEDNKKFFKDYEIKRIDLCIPKRRYELKSNETYILETGFDKINGVSFSKGCFIGQEVTAKMRHKTTLKNGLVKLQTFKIPLKPNTQITNEKGQLAGHVSSSINKKGLGIIKFIYAKGKLFCGENELKIL